jgi:hypothetical protein
MFQRAMETGEAAGKRFDIESACRKLRRARSYTGAIDLCLSCARLAEERKDAETVAQCHTLVRETLDELVCDVVPPGEEEEEEE